MSSRPNKFFYLCGMKHTPFTDKNFLEYSGYVRVNTPEEADYLISTERRWYTEELLALKKPNIIWTHEPFIEKGSEFVVHDNGAVYFIFSMFMGNIYTDNFFYGPGGILPHVTEDSLNTDFENKRIGVLSTNRNTQRMVDGVDFSLDTIRSELALDLHQIEMASIVGRGWPDGVAEDESRDGNWAETKNVFLKNFNWSLCFENTCFRGYTSEKLWQCIEGRNMPIYFDNGAIYDTFPVDSFLDYSKLGGPEDLVEVVRSMSLDEYLGRMNSCIDVYNHASARGAGRASRCLTWDAIIKHMPIVDFARMAYLAAIPNDYDGGNTTKLLSSDYNLDVEDTGQKNLLTNGRFEAWSGGKKSEVGSHHAYPADDWNAYRDAYEDGLIITAQDAPEGRGHALRMAINAGSNDERGANISQDLLPRVSKKMAGRRIGLTFKFRCGPGFHSKSGLSCTLVGSTGSDAVSRSGPPDRHSEVQRFPAEFGWTTASMMLDVPQDKTQLHVTFAWIPDGPIGEEHWLELSNVRLFEAEISTAKKLDALKAASGISHLAPIDSEGV